MFLNLLARATEAALGVPKAAAGDQLRELPVVHAELVAEQVAQYPEATIASWASWLAGRAKQEGT
jgi:hypothetical protein